ncbi:MAG: TldD/PmbA family protein [Nanoarchaeota archaeon]|nr:TldD/PmbA family protein [Nanoarchaeota archaeon]
MEIINYIKNQLVKKGADNVVVNYVKSEGKQLKFVNNQIVKTGTEILDNINIFVVKDKKIVSTSLKELDKKSADKIIDKIMKFIKFVEPKEDYKGIAKGGFEYKEIKDRYDKKVLDMDEVDYLNKGMNKALEFSKRVSGILESGSVYNYLVTSEGVDAEDKSTNLYFSIRAFNEKDESGHMATVSRMLNKFDVEDAGKRAGEIAKMVKKPVGGEAGKFDLVLGYMTSACLLNCMMESASVFNVESGMSFLQGKIAKKICSFDFIDDGSLENGYNSVKFDGEGSPVRKNYIIKDGVLRTYLHNNSTSKKYGVKNTGNAGLISPSPWNIIINGKRGNVFDIKKGLYVTNVWYTRFNNYTTGDFSTIPRDGIFLIENGKIVKSLKNIRISDNMLNIMKNVALLSKKNLQIKSWEAEIPVLTPEILVKDVNVTKPHS